MMLNCGMSRDYFFPAYFTVKQLQYLCYCIRVDPAMLQHSRLTVFACGDISLFWV